METVAQKYYITKEGNPIVELPQQTPIRKRRYKELGVTDEVMKHIKEYRAKRSNKTIEKKLNRFRTMAKGMKEMVDIINNLKYKI
jgi:hypothetical protein